MNELAGTLSFATSVEGNFTDHSDELYLDTHVVKLPGVVKPDLDLSLDRIISDKERELFGVFLFSFRVGFFQLDVLDVVWQVDRNDRVSSILHAELGQLDLRKTPWVNYNLSTLG